LRSGKRSWAGKMKKSSEPWALSVEVWVAMEKSVEQ
jgi:hypothetical protein